MFNVEVPWVAVTMSDMKTVQKMQKDKIFNQNLILQ